MADEDPLLVCLVPDGSGTPGKGDGSPASTETDNSFPGGVKNTP
ncbi:MAG: hypothetical protein O3A87_01155 [Verrucomicrobia bacterium]|nr:hypothetical protein [Verrucomicrobiota bacterium]MDA1005078.1 hypothetical protein [Verrucomicrobiota bacterium]